MEQAGKQVSTALSAFSLFVWGENPEEPPADLAIVARQVCVSEKYLCHCFKKAFRVTPQRYLLSMRIKKAERLLKTTDLLLRI